ncbi:hypothetical protein ACLD43_11135 [Clostridium botulinum]|uniref:Uncharacterized protein n=1 Tax=Clostridium botulinum TaxID=1491 RepID=A0A846JAB6_CLOBO|nr:hypothetical protein [Clostridium botulinum]ACA56234.1 conserved hypothetical protein [Clostridium botulinum A3 str. Loch Maree]NFH67480.1 hypothetical protein [Clostridium botulinum]NFJ08987.1 hypothetical protein [Clostridium botulinum]NFK16255.1 hypothetical protein [Clostridium botulinum]NFM92444.1 hypothetical protein [Clostridium botulinum]
MVNSLFLFSIIILFIGFFFMGMSKLSFKWRAFTNKPAWNGATIPFLMIGLVFFIIGLILVYIFYPFK